MKILKGLTTNVMVLRKLFDVASEICGYNKGKPRHFETWRWIE